ncbi:hypothetical protein HRbin02_01728 [Candidatus Calditenuaceae archaeon HR02]|nr:hypothetical protein HRbin02_01728 [Candidatus Calditenuaceae archaeon HR02]
MFELPIGGRSAASYAAAAIAALMSGQRVLLKARGRWISKAVDVSQIAVKIFRNAVIAGVSMGSDQLTTDGRSRMVSSIEIVLEPSPPGNQSTSKRNSSRRRVKAAEPQR